MTQITIREAHGAPKAFHSSRMFELCVGSCKPFRVEVMQGKDPLTEIKAAVAREGRVHSVLYPNRTVGIFKHLDGFDFDRLEIPTPPTTRP